MTSWLDGLYIGNSFFFPNHCSQGSIANQSIAGSVMHLSEMQLKTDAFQLGSKALQSSVLVAYGTCEESMETYIFSIFLNTVP